MNIEKMLAKIENEAKQMKTVFELGAASIPIHEAQVDLVTTENKLKFSRDGEGFEENQYERVEVIFMTDTGSNTIATLEVETDQDLSTGAFPSIQRVGYSGGARWVVSGFPQYDANGWKPTVYTFRVKSMIGGRLTARNMAS